MRADFDAHKRVRYNDTPSLFWAKYPYKVVVRMPRHYADSWKSGRYLGKLSRHCPEDSGRWRLLCAPSAPSFFFLTREEALHFIDANLRHVADVWRPVTAEATQLLERDDAGYWPVMRDALFYEAYRFCVVFRRTTSLAEEEEIDSWVQDFFVGSDDKRYYYSYSSERRLYLNDDSDVFMCVLAYKTNIIKIERVILRDEIHGRELGTEAAGHAGYQAGHGDGCPLPNQ